MLERMAGHSDQAAPKPAAGSISERVNERVAVRARQQDADFDDLASPDASGDNVEIPAFLRRQAN
jgi:cell division protein FtsZ